MTRFLFAMFIGLALVACEKDGASESSDGGKINAGDTDSGDTNANVDQGGGSDGKDSSFDEGDTGGTDPIICHDEGTPIVIRPAHLMLLLDASVSMGPEYPGDPNPDKWTVAKEAIDNMTATYGDRIHFGLDSFPASSNRPPAPGFSFDMCKVGLSVIEEIGLNNGHTITTALEALAPAGSTPLYLAMERYLNAAHSTSFPNEEATNYLVVISDGGDTCGTTGSQNYDVTPDILTALSTDLLDNHSVHSIVIGFGEGVSPEELNAIAEAGGTEFAEYIIADPNEPQSLDDALNDIAESVVPCEYNFSELDPTEVDFNNIRFFFDDKEVPYNENCKAAGKGGWKWDDEDHTIVRLCDVDCNQLKKGMVAKVTSTMGCPPTIVVVE